MADHDHDTVDAIARKLRDVGCPHPYATAAEVMAIIRGRGWRYVIERAPDWAHGGGLPTPDSDAARALADVKARFETRTGHG